LWDIERENLPKTEKKRGKWVREDYRKRVTKKKTNDRISIGSCMVPDWV